MQPLCLTLKGFRGIRDGLGRDALTLDLERLAGGAELVAIAGANGRGKTTVMDNMHPYLTMPSRAAVAGPGGFSYYDHVFLPESVKDLTWSHEGRCYRSQVVVRLNGRRRTEAFLHRLDDQGRWQPMQADDGTVSDGKVETYNRCVQAVCGSADTFFTSVFAAQGKRQLSTYRNAEIKTLLADLLGQEEIRALGQKAGETARLLKAGLSAIHLELAGLDAEAERVAAERGDLDGAEGRAEQGLAALQSAQLALEAARTRHAQLLALQTQSTGIEARRRQLQGECDAVARVGKQAIEALKVRDQGEQQRLERLQRRVAQRAEQARLRRKTLEDRHRQCLAVLAGEAAVLRSVNRLPLAERVLAARVTRVDSLRQRLASLVSCQGLRQAAEHRLIAIEREAGQAALKSEELLLRFGLTGEVPCAGSDLQGRCKLLGDAREAQALIPGVRTTIQRLAQVKSDLRQELQSLDLRLRELGDAPQALGRAERRCESARARCTRLALLAARAGEMAQARSTLCSIEQELVAIQRGKGDPGRDQTEQATEMLEEQAERRDIAAARQAIATQHERQVQSVRDTLDRLAQALAALPLPFDESLLADALRVMDQASQAVTAAGQAHARAVRDAERLRSLEQQARTLAVRRSAVLSRMKRIEGELGNWNLFARCMNNDGLIALAIDDAGPALSGLANDLLLACHGPRFTVSILTLLQTGSGDQKEGFDIVVHDGDSGDSKSIGLMSGGERTWIEAGLTRAIALYLAQHAGRHYTTLFSDEADGALDPERKRMFMAMKREVLRLGGYEREFFVSQTPELTVMADVVIDLEDFAADAGPALLSRAIA